VIEGDSLEYEFLENAVKQLTDPIGVSVELGVRRGLGSKIIIDTYRKHYPNTVLVHLGIDPYGNIKYNDNDQFIVRLDYTNTMRQQMIADFATEYPEFHFVNLEDSEFFKRYQDGYPVYEQFKRLLNKYEIVHFDGPHDTINVMKEVEFFEARKPKQCVYIFDDIANYNIDKIGDYLLQKGFKELDKGKRKRSYEYKS